VSALRQLVIVHSGGTRTLELYRVDSRSRSFSARGEVAKGTPRRTRVIGDRLENPSELSVTAYLEEATLGASYALAQQIITECETASGVLYHEGVQAVNGITRAGVDVDGLGVKVSLSFAPTTATVLLALTFDLTVYSWDATNITFDATVLP
jgi:hypothetical protein